MWIWSLLLKALPRLPIGFRKKTSLKWSNRSCKILPSPYLASFHIALPLLYQLQPHWTSSSTFYLSCQPAPGPLQTSSFYLKYIILLHLTNIYSSFGSEYLLKEAFLNPPVWLNLLLRNSSSVCSTYHSSKGTFICVIIWLIFVNPNDVKVP